MSFVSGGMGRRGKCATKHPYRTRAAAERAIDSLEARGVYRPGLEIYPCKDHFHIGHAMAKDRKGRRK